MQVNAVAQPTPAPQAPAGTMQAPAQGQDFMAVIMQMLGNASAKDLEMLNLLESNGETQMSDDEMMEAMQMLSGLFINPMVTANPEMIVPTEMQAGLLQTATQQPMAKTNETIVLPQHQTQELIEILKSTDQSQQPIAAKQSADNTQLFTTLLNQQQKGNEIMMPKQTTPLDIDELQVAVDEFRFLGTSSIASKVLTVPVATPPNVQETEILSQVKTGILTEMANGKNEFIIKLKPEGLGDVTVKMVEQSGKISMSIITSNQQTQHVLNSQISSLQEALRPLNAEVTQVVTETTANMFHQGFAEQQQNQARQQNRTYHGGEDGTLGEGEETYAEKLESVLDSYI